MNSQGSRILDLVSPLFEAYRDKVSFAYLFGSTAEERMSPLSDIDVAIFLESEERQSQFKLKMALHAELCRMLNRNDIDILVLNTVNNIVLLEEIVRHGRVIFDGNEDLREDFEQKVIHRAIDFKLQRLATMGV